jgi:hypothetical protein
MNQTAPDAENVLLPSQNIPQESASGIPGYWNCLTCADLGATCNGPSLRTLGDIATVRTFHKEIRKTRSITLRAIYKAAPQISETTINEYFSNAVKDFKWTTVSHIDHALLSICGNRVGLPPLDHACPASSSDVRNQLAAADLNLAAANVTNASLQAECDDLRRRLADSDGSHVAQLAEMHTSKASEIEWFKNGILFWRRFALGLVFILFFVLLMLGFCAAWILAHF